MHSSSCNRKRVMDAMAASPAMQWQQAQQWNGSKPSNGMAASPRNGMAASQAICKWQQAQAICKWNGSKPKQYAMEWQLAKQAICNGMASQQYAMEWQVQQGSNMQWNAKPSKCNMQWNGNWPANAICNCLNGWLGQK
eukprot:1402590-Amphidinium_carterae.1